MNLQAVNGEPGNRILPNWLDAQLTFFLDYAERALQDFVRALSKEERLNSPHIQQRTRARQARLEGLPAD
jgi:hypothetical protein